MIELLLDLQFIQRGILAGIVASIICPIIGSFLVVRRLSLISEALSHVTLAGIGLGVLLAQTAYLYWLNPLYMGLLIAVLGAIYIDRLRFVFKHYPEISIPIVLSVGVGFGIILISITNSMNVSFLNVLFGSIVSVTLEDLYFILFAAILIIGIILLVYKEMFSISFDPEFAKTSGIPQKWLNILFAILVAITISIAMRVVGILLVSSLITIPVATSLRIARSYKQVIGYAILFAQTAMLLGIILGYYLNVATGGMVVVVSVVQLVVILLAQSIFSRRTKGGRV